MYYSICRGSQISA